MDYISTARSVEDRLLSYRKDDSGWKICKKTNDVVVYWRPSSEFAGYVYKGEGFISDSPEKVWHCLKPEINGFRVKWDSNLKKFELVEQVSELPMYVTPAVPHKPATSEASITRVAVSVFLFMGILEKRSCLASFRQILEVCSRARSWIHFSPAVWWSFTTT